MVKPDATPGCMGCSCLPWRNHPFFDAAAQGDHVLVSNLLASDITLIRVVVGRKHLTAWHIAAKEGHVEVLRALVAAVITCPTAHTELNSSIRRLLSMARTGERLAKHFLNTRSSGGTTPLMMAAKHGHVPVIDYLMAVGGNPWLADARGLTALHIAAINNQCEVIHELCKVTIPFSRLALSPNSSDTAYVDVLDPFGWTPLHHAVLAGRLEATKTLLSHHANITARTMYHNIKVDLLPTGLTALHLAAYKGNLPIAKALLRTYFEQNSDLMPSQTSLMTTAEQRQRQLTRGPDPRLVLTRTARLPYHFAYRMSHTFMLEWLDPSIPLMFLFAGTDEGSASGEGVIVGAPRLIVIASKALHDLLSRELQELEEQLATHADRIAQAREELEKQAVTKGHPPQDPAQPKSPTSKNLRILGPFTRLRAMSSGGSVTSAPPAHRRTSSTSSLAPGAAGRGSKPGVKTTTPRAKAGPGGGGEQDPVDRPSSVDSKRDVLHLGEGNAGLMVRLKQGVRLARTPGPSRACTEQDLLRMGISIPQNVDSDPVAVVVQSVARSPGSIQTQGSSTQHPWQDRTWLSYSPGTMTQPGAQPLLTLGSRARASEPGRPVPLLSGASAAHHRRTSTQEHVHSRFYLTSHLAPPSSDQQPLERKPSVPATPPAAQDGHIQTQLLVDDAHPDQQPLSDQAMQLPGEIKLDTPTLDAPVAAWATGTSPRPAEPQPELRPGLQAAAAITPKRQGSLRRDSPTQQPDSEAAPDSSTPSDSNAAQVLKARCGGSNQVHPAGQEGVLARAEQAWGGEELPADSKPHLPVHMRLPTLEESMPGRGTNGGELVSEAGSKVETRDGDLNKDVSGAGGGDDEDDEDVCPVCLDEPPNIKVRQCGHQLCMTCAKDLCKRHQLTPALCPYCRIIIPGFTAVLAALPTSL